MKFNIKYKIDKKFIKTTVITLLVILILAGGFMLFGKGPLSKFYYRSAVSDINNNDNIKASEKLNTALALDNKNHNARFRLVEVYKTLLEYDKAEKLLLDGISMQQSNTNYYKELILLYVESERVEKALEFIDSIDHEYVLVQLNKERPSPLDSSPTQGRYEKTVKVTLSSEDEDVKIYYTTDGSTPNLKSELYDGPIKISSGNVTIKAFAINEKGLISDELILEYSINTANQYVDFVDEKMEQLIRREVNIYGQAIYPAEIEGITSISNLDAAGNRISGDIKSLEDLQWLPNLKEITLVDEKGINNIALILNQRKLSSLNLSGCEVNADILSRLSELEQLEYLNLDNNGITDIEFLRDMKGLLGLSLAKNIISDLSPLEEHLSLAELDVSNNAISNISVLQKLYLIKDLNLSGNTLKDLNNLALNTKIEKLDVSNCGLKSLSGVTRLEALKELNASKNSISDFGDIKEGSQLDYLDLSENGIGGISFVEGLYVKKLNLSNNGIKNIKPLKKAEGLQNLDLSKNKISNVEPLKELEELTFVNLSDNSIKKLEPLKESKSLTEVIVTGNEIADFDKLSGALFSIVK
ncbi:MAG: leucine-rich repeat domain-containing protein [Clostridia bacterium]|nr:leucine-rich repeat domain-containing protein [Clostridia bacterium]